MTDLGDMGPFGYIRYFAFVGLLGIWVTGKWCCSELREDDLLRNGRSGLAFVVAERLETRSVGHRTKKTYTVGVVTIVYRDGTDLRETDVEVKSSVTADLPEPVTSRGRREYGQTLLSGEDLPEDVSVAVRYLPGQSGDDSAYLPGFSEPM